VTTEAASPAERYSQFRRNQSGPALAEFEVGYPFGLDAFQRTACAALEAGRGVLVAAPTGAGKTVVGEFAVHLALREGASASTRRRSRRCRTRSTATSSSATAPTGSACSPATSR
jgi:ATP-dependent RNA helicase HelY